MNQLTCLTCGEKMDAENLPVKYHRDPESGSAVPYVECTNCGWRLYAEWVDDEEDEDTGYQDYLDYLASMQGA